MSTPRVHVHMTVSDLAKSRAFYETFLGVSPVKVKPGYVKFLPPWGPLNLALSDGRAAGEGHVNHMGVQLALRDDVMTQLQRPMKSTPTGGVGFYRSGLEKKDIPSYFVGGFEDPGGALRWLREAPPAP